MPTQHGVPAGTAYSGDPAGRADTVIDHALALTHIDERGAARMVDVSEKPVTLRVAKASGLVIDHALALTHIDERGAARMVDVSEKPVTLRVAKVPG